MSLRMESPIQDKALVIKELIVRLASYYDITDKEASKLVTEVIHSLEAQALVLQKNRTTPNAPNFQYALRSILMVIRRLHATNLERFAKSLSDLQDLSDTMRTHNIKQFIAFLNSLHL